MAIKYGDYTYTADFETTSYEQYQIDGMTRVWLWDVCKVKSLTHTHGYSLDTFFEYLNRNKKTKTLFFHNLKFDGKFIIDYLFRTGFNISLDDKLRPNEFKTLINKMNTFFSIEIKTERCKIVIYDSLLKIPLPVAKIPAAFGFDDIISKGDIDYIMYRGEDYIATPEEINYIERDTEIPARALQILFSKGRMKMTQSSDSLAAYKEECRYFDKIYPKIPKEIDDYIRPSYRGGWTYIKEEWSDVTIGVGTSYDNNSLYPSRMTTCLLPYGEPIYFEGEYVDDPFHPLYVTQIMINCDLKEGYLPTLQCHTSNSFQYQSSEMFLSTTNNEVMKFTVTSIDLQLIYKHYDIHEIRYLGGYKFKGSYELFRHYILELNRIKTTTTDKGERQLAKLSMNSLYGKTGMNPEKESKVPFFDPETNMVDYSKTITEIGDGVYLPVACFITAYGRLETITQAQAVYPRFVYADTDSIHLIGLDVPNIPIDDKKLGYWKNEGVFVKARFLKSKTYIKLKLRPVNVVCYIYVKNKLFKQYPRIIYSTYYDTKCAGLSKSIAADTTKVNMNNFHIGLTVPGGRTLLRTVPGGCVIEQTEFNILPPKKEIIQDF